MNKDIILELIDKKINHLSYIEEKIKDFNNIDEKISEYLKELVFSKNYLKDVCNELNNNIIPNDFYSKIHTSVEMINTKELFTALNMPHFQINTDSLKSYCQNYPLNSFSSFVTYKFYKDLGFLTDNIVVVGANGSGKSTLADNLKTIIDGKYGVVIPAQKLLIIPTFENIPNYNSSSREYDEYQKNYTDGKTTYNASQTNDIPYTDTQKYGSEYKYVLKTLMAERSHIRNIFCTNYSNDVNVNKTDLHSKLDTAIEIWNSLIEHRVMYINESNELNIKDPSKQEEYPAYRMSDGEKNILYLIGRVLLAKEDSVIIIDEPEMYLHKSIVNKLWDKLELLRQDCIFIYLTHDLDFASSRKANKYWIRDFKYPMIWDINAIPENEIPENLLMKLLESRKKYCSVRVKITA
ncbi:AAA family ATPase [Balneicella halophila]|uniref:AAA family ATPase n=1 Tax=Balneicella halophila TaxID=1537566 RepID=UPI000E2FF781|nr:AAA family ATPase [Balneicella halophila]